MQGNDCELKKGYFEGGRSFVYAAIYKDLGFILYNTDFEGDTKIFLMVPDNKEAPNE